eukprot:CAMPEP_0114681342 /NCGR_PEP_ID=MMETSP0191-20121206/55265_1 /TAXON_ID=126664 /ORGANISM="Sorites sp." /LENGTH=35 /DNA_ID= /DNA_START= /DNA_END= /DNA_ORIENTATION=
MTGEDASHDGEEGPIILESADEAIGEASGARGSAD